MRFLISILFFFPALIFNGLPYKLNQGLTFEDVKEIQELNALTIELSKSSEFLQIPVQFNFLNISTDDVTFFVHNRENNNPSEVFVAQAKTITSVSQFNTSLPTIFLINGWHDTHNSTFNQELSKAYLNVRDVNIINVNWDELAKLFYLSAYAALPTVGQYIGQFINNISKAYDYDLDNFSIVGHSLGAHIAGFAGQETNGSIHSITGLDTAGPLFFKSRPDSRLSESDAQYVQAIHTNAGFLGVNFNVGHSDFWPNGGKKQPGCSADRAANCAHARSYIYFAESLSSNEFVSKECDSYIDYLNGECKRVLPSIMGGAYVNTTLLGSFYLQTNDSSPYALGDTDL